MNVTIDSTALRGKISAIPAKAAAHRALIAAALSGGTVDVRIGDAELSQDISATIRCLEQLGAKITAVGGGVSDHDVHCLSISALSLAPASRSL